MTPSALVVGGTGPTGPFVVDGLQRRGYTVSVFHRGTHELDELAGIEHIHGDPHFAETIADALGTRRFDVVVATYGRTRLLAAHLAGRCEQFIGVGGSAVYPGWVEPAGHRPFGVRILVPEDEPLVEQHVAPTKAQQFTNKLIQTERAVFTIHRDEGFRATWFRYPRIYGPRNLMPYEWSPLKRIRDQRPFIILHDGGLQIRTRCAAQNAAHSILLAVDHPDVAAGQTYNVGDSLQASERQWVELIAHLLGAELRVVSLPMAMSSPSWYLTPFASTASPHCLFDTTKIRTELGYRDVIAPETALRETLRWLDEHPPTPEEYPAYQDYFDYALEDQLVDAYEAALDDVRARSARAAPRRPTHAYAHPTTAAAGDAAGTGTGTGSGTDQQGR